MSDLSHKINELQKRAAVFGPGLNGVRENPGESVREELVTAFDAVGLSAPEYLLKENQWVDRKAKLFEAGEYPDKNLSVTSEDLVRIAESFDLPVPVLIEHSSSPLELGYLTKVEAVGNELFGVLSLTEPADALIVHSGAKGLSVGLGEDLNEICEVSIVKHPRVSSAQLFNWNSEHALENLEVPKSVARRSSSKAKSGISAESNLNTKIDDWLRTGQMLPSQAKIARKLSKPIGQFAEGNELSKMIVDIFELQPSHGLFKNQTEEQLREGNNALLLPEEAAFFRQHFPSVSLDEIARRHCGGRS